MNNNARRFLQRASSEIKELRRENEIMRARLDMFDSMNLIFHTRPNQENRGMSPDLVYEIEKFIESE